MSKALRVFIGRDERQPLSYSVCASSVVRHAKSRVSIEAIGPDWIPGFTRNGLTQFTFRRYLPPLLCDYEGVSIFMDGDIIVRADVNELADLARQQPDKDVFVAQHVLPFERPSVMVFNNERCRALTIDYIQTGEPPMLDWARTVGEIPPEWNHCVGYEAHREDAKLIHFTAGIPCWPETADSPHAEKWAEEHQHANGTVTWKELMGRSVHAALVKQKMLRRGVA